MRGFAAPACPIVEERSCYGDLLASDAQAQQGRETVYIMRKAHCPFPSNIQDAKCGENWGGRGDIKRYRSDQDDVR